MAGLVPLGWLACGAAILLWGCVFIDPLLPCVHDADCDDGAFCNGQERCGEGNCLDGVSPCAEPAPFCDEQSETCRECESAADCEAPDECTAAACLDDGACLRTSACADDGLFCNGDEYCDAETAECAHSGDPCGDRGDCEPCSETSQACPLYCEGNASCDDDNVCTIDSCINNCACLSTPLDCDDNDPCTVESCDPDSGCVHVEAECPPGLVCVSATGDCELAECEDDSDCWDELFCNGYETCVERLCVAGVDPCEPGETCFELEHCMIIDPCDPFTLTLAQDIVDGDGCGSIVYAPLVFNAPTGTHLPSLQTFDKITLGGGHDTLNALVNSTVPTTIAATLTSIERVFIQDVGDPGDHTTISGVNSTGIKLVGVLNSASSFAVTFDNLKSVVDASVANAHVGIAVAFVSAATTRDDDTIDLELSKVTATADSAESDVRIQTANTNGIEVLNITSAGAANVIRAIVQTTGTTLHTVTIGGSTSLGIGNPLPDSVTTVDASETVAGVTVSAGVASSGATITGGSGNDTLTGGRGADTLAGGDGEDTFRFDNSAAIDAVTDWSADDDLIGISAGDTFGSGGNVGLAQGGGAVGSLMATPAGAVVVTSVARNSVPLAVGGTQFFKLATSSAYAGSDQATFNSAIGTASLTGVSASTAYAGSFFDATSGQMVLFEVLSANGSATAIESGDTIRVIARITTTEASYQSLAPVDVEIY